MSNDNMLWRARFKKSGSSEWNYISLGLELLDLEDSSYCRWVAINDLGVREIEGEKIEAYELAYTAISDNDDDFYLQARYWEKINETRSSLFIG